MNCRPGDAAFIVAPYLDLAMRGVVVSVMRAHYGHGFVLAKDGSRSHSRGSACWLVDGHDQRLPIVIADYCLRPFRDPGDDAVDESLLWVRITEVDTV